jgi:hypothetical protein
VKKKEDVWNDLEFLERALELAPDSYTREKYAMYIQQAKQLIISSLVQEVEDRTLSARAFKDVTGISFREARSRFRLPLKRLPVPDPATAEFSRNAIKTLMGNAKFRATNSSAD